ncbi:MAG: hypothetical protein R3C05_27235 [Pirellulaceae bacterium]
MVSTSPITSSGELRLTINPTATGSSTITVRATNSFGLFTQTSFTVSVTQAFDFGDAPDPTYKTLLASGGPQHAGSDRADSWAAWWIMKWTVSPARTLRGTTPTAKMTMTA